MFKLNEPVATVAVSQPAKSREKLDLRPGFEAALAAGRLVVCEPCRYFTSKQTTADGYCRLYRCDTWGRVPFQCSGYKAGKGKDAKCSTEKA